MSHLFLQGDAVHIPLPDQSVDLVFGSPPYIDARLYLEEGQNLGIARGCRDWVAWMLKVTREAIRVSRGPVLWVVAGKTEDRCYQPGPEGLVWEWYRSGGSLECPCYWHRVGIPGSGGDQWFRKDVEYVLCFKREAKFPWSNNTACGAPPKWGPGGEMSHRLSDGTRTNQWGKTGTQTGTTADGKGEKPHTGKPRPSHRMTSVSEIGGRTKKVSGERRMNGEIQAYIPPAMANPGTYLPIEEMSSVVDVIVGGGQMGHALSHLSEAPFPEKLADHFIKSLCRPGGTVLDPFSGSGTSVSVATRLGRRGIGLDLRMSQGRIGVQRLERPHQAVPKRSQKTDPPMPLFAASEEGGTP